MCLVVLPVLVENRAAVAVVLVGCSVLYMGSLRNYRTVLVENGVVITSEVILVSFVFGQTREPLAMAESGSGSNILAGDLSPPPCQSRKPEKVLFSVLVSSIIWELMIFLTLSGPHPSPPHPFHQARTIRAPTQYPANNLGPNLRVTAPGSSGAQLQKKFRSGGNPGLGEEQLFTWSMHQLLRWMHHLPSRPGSRFSL